MSHCLRLCHCFKRDRFVCKRGRVTGTARIKVSPERVRLADCYTAMPRYRKLGKDKLELACCLQPRDWKTTQGDIVDTTFHGTLHDRNKYFYQATALDARYSPKSIILFSGNHEYVRKALYKLSWTAFQKAFKSAHEKQGLIGLCSTTLFSQSFCQWCSLKIWWHLTESTMSRGGHSLSSARLNVDGKDDF